MQKPKKWHEVYPYGTKEGDEEAKVFRALGRHPKYDYRSTSALIKATGVSRDRIEEVIDKYVNCNPPLIFAHPTNEEHWGYWERCQDRLKDDDRDISEKDKDGRIGKHLAGASMVDNSGKVVGGASAQLTGSITNFTMSNKASPKGYVRSKYPMTYFDPRKWKIKKKAQQIS